MDLGNKTSDLKKTCLMFLPKANLLTENNLLKQISELDTDISQESIDYEITGSKLKISFLKEHLNGIQENLIWTLRKKVSRK